MNGNYAASGCWEAKAAIGISPNMPTAGYHRNSGQKRNALVFIQAMSTNPTELASADSGFATTPSFSRNHDRRSAKAREPSRQARWGCCLRLSFRGL